MSAPDTTETEALAMLLAEHDGYGRKPLPRNNADRDLSRIRYGWFCDCGHELPWNDDGVAHRAHVAEKLQQQVAIRDAAQRAAGDRRLELLRLVVAYDNANQSDLPLPLLDGIRAEAEGPR